MKRNDYIVIQEPMISTLGLSGVSLLVFAVIHGFTKDGEQHYRAFPEDLMRWTGASERSVKGVLKSLLDSGYINRSKVTYRGKSTFEYWTNYDELLDRVSAGDVLQKPKGAKFAPLAKVQKLHPNSAEIAPIKVQNLPCKGAEIAPEPNNNVVKHTSKHTSNYFFNLDAARQTGPIRQEEEQEFFRIFFEKNAADPAAEVKRFISFNESRGWESADGRRYDTPMKRRGLAWMWELKKGTPLRLTAEFGTAAERAAQADANAAFLKMLGELYEVACAEGDPEDPTLMLNPDFRCRLSWKEGGAEYDLIWSGTRLPAMWYDRHVEVAAPIVRKHFKKLSSLVFAS